MLRVHFVGIVYFNVCTLEQRLALFPNGTGSSDGMPSHHAGFFIEANRHDADDWWPDSKFVRMRRFEDKPGVFRTAAMYEFRIPEPAEVTFHCGDKKLDIKNLDEALPKIHEIAPEFELDVAHGDTIVRVPITGGTLEVFRFDPAGAVVSWSIADHPDPITITAKAGQSVRTVTLKAAGTADTEIVFSNTPDLLS